jgi:2-polyprenyl-6-methoxyphenol hydroxylase-like FAD-dependent oxidoreductase
MTAKSTVQREPIGEHAIVLGASMAGLLAARVLADFYTTVTVVERDILGDSVAARRGVPQGRHTHALLMRGAQALEELFPDLLAQLVDGGAVLFDGTDLSKFYFCMKGTWPCALVRPTESGPTT